MAQASITFRSFDVTGEVVVENDRLLPDVEARLPPGWKPAAPAGPCARLTFAADGTVLDGDVPITPDDGQEPLDTLESAIRTRVALDARDFLFVHAGAAAFEGRAILIPGKSLAGKSTLVAALVAAGAEYYSDDFAILDMDGRVHPYPRPLSIRPTGSTRQQDFAVGALGGVAADRAADVAIIATVRWMPERKWRPTRVTAGDGALALLGQTLTARVRPSQALATVRRAAEGAIVIEGARGEAHEAADGLIALLKSADGA